MRDGFIRVGAATPKVQIADPVHNADETIRFIWQAEEKKIKLLAFPELGLTGYTCGDLFLQKKLLDCAKEQLLRIASETKKCDVVSIIGLPLYKDGNLYNCAAVVQHGNILGIVPKNNIPNYAEFYEKRHFINAPQENTTILVEDNEVPFGTNLLFECENFHEFIFGIEICEDLWVPTPISGEHTMAGANIMVNLSASNETVSKDQFRSELVKNQSARCVCGYVYANAGEGESTTDLVFAGHNLIYENGQRLTESQKYTTGIVFSEIDLFKLTAERRRINSYVRSTPANYQKLKFKVEACKYDLTRTYDTLPFLPREAKKRGQRCEDIVNIQCHGLAQRLSAIHCNTAVIGLSGGLDSTHALLVTVRAFDLLGLDRKGIISVTMPCFGTTDRTYSNAVALAEKLGTSLKVVNIKESVLRHFSDIGQDPGNTDVTYENAQARERTQVLMDIANQLGGIVIGTGDLSELALGWATYNGDHMSMYGVNASIPKTLMRYVIAHIADGQPDDIRILLEDVLDTPVSPELLPHQDGQIQQKTEDIVGPYELHDFFLFYMLRYGFRPSKIYRIANLAFAGTYDKTTVKKWLNIFYRRFFTQQFKRSCLPDGPKVGSVALSPRGDFRMPSDASAKIWLDEIDAIKDE